MRIRVVEGSTVNAFATLGGRIFVFEGLLRELDSENSLAMVLGHEVAHLVNRDPLLGTGRGILVAIAVSYVAGTSVDLSFVDFELIALNMYSREQERAADLVAAQALYRNYGHIGGATRLFSILEATDSGPGTLEVLSTHPDSNRRIQAIESMAEQKVRCRKDEGKVYHRLKPPFEIEVLDAYDPEYAGQANSNHIALVGHFGMRHRPLLNSRGLGWQSPRCRSIRRPLRHLPERSGAAPYRPGA